MAQRRYYRVAEHVFSIEAPEEMLVQLTSYEPFRIWDKPHEVRFDLTIGISPLAVEDREHVFTDVSDDDMPRIEVYRVKQNWLFCIAMSKEGPVCSRLLTTADFRQAWLEIDTQYASFAINNAAMLLYAFSTAHLSTLEMHAAVAVRKGKGYLFLGKSGTGKSTHAPCYKNLSVEVGAIVKLSQAPHNEARRLKLPEAYAYMLSSASGLKVVPEVMDSLYLTISRLIQSTPVFALECLPDTDAAQVCWTAVTNVN